MRRSAAHALAFSRGRIAGAHPGAELDARQTAPSEFPLDPAQRRLQIAVDVGGQCLERRDVDHLGRISESAFYTLTDKFVDRRKKCGKRFARTRRRCDQGMTARFDHWPGFSLSRGRLGEVVSKPLCHRWMEELGEIHSRQTHNPMSRISYGCDGKILVSRGGPPLDRDDQISAFLPGTP